jgi:hypothetical protein
LNDRDFLQLDVKQTSRTTHKIIVEVTDQAWLNPDRIDALKEAVHDAVARLDWTLENREMGPLGLVSYDPKSGQLPMLRDSPPGLTILEIVAR